MVLHRHVRKRDQSSFLLQEQFFFLPPRYRLGHLRSCHWHARLTRTCTRPAVQAVQPSCLAPALPCPWDCHVPNTHEVQSSHITSYLPPIYTSPSKLWYPIPFLPFPPYQAARPMPALLGSRI